MLFDRNWRKHRHKQLKKFAYHRMPPNTYVALFPYFFWLWGIQIIAAAFGMSASKAVRWWAICILPLLTAAFLIAAYYRERDRGLAGFFRYLSAFFVLVGLSIIELAITFSIHETVPYALLISLFTGLITFAIVMYYIYKQVEYGPHSKDDQQDPKAAPFLAGALGCGTYMICKQLFSKQGTSAFVVTVIGVMVAIMFGGAAMNWLKSFGAEDVSNRSE